MPHDLEKELSDQLRSLHHVFSRHLKKADRTVAHLNRLLSSPQGLDRLLMTLSYTLTFVSPQLSRLSSLLSLKLQLPEPLHSTLLLLPPSATHIRSLSRSAHNFAALISDVRCFLRLFGLLSIYSWAQSVLRSPPKDPILRRIGYAQLGVNIAYQALENIAYLSSHKVLRLGKGREREAWLWSSRFWAAHVGLEAWRLERERRLRLARKKRGVDMGGAGREEREQEAWIREWVMNAAYAPLTLHWSVKDGLIPQSAVGMLGMVAAVTGLRDVWRNSE